MVMSEWTDIEDIVSRAQRGDRQAYGDLFEAFWPSIYAMALARLRDVDEAQDLAQDVWVHAYMKLGQLRQPAAFAGWLRQITARMVINRVSRRRPEARAHDNTLIDNTAAACDAPLEQLIQREELDGLRQGLDRLKPMDRDTLLAFYYQDQSLETISRESATPVGTIKRRLHVARKRLRQEVECASQ
jgi:RNA polymerase sigma-70 factor (ECF subfamily)